MTIARSKIGLMATLAFGLACLLAHGQNYGGERRVLKSDAVQFMFPEQVTVVAGKASVVALHFRIAQGLHINSHTPKDEFLIPTTFSIPEGAGVRIESATYPAGTELVLPMDPKNKISVYTGEFTILARIVASKGNNLVEAKLRYQACDNSACMPPKTIAVAIDVIGQ